MGICSNQELILQEKSLVAVSDLALPIGAAPTISGVTIRRINCFPTRVDGSLGLPPRRTLPNWRNWWGYFASLYTVCH